MASIWKILLNGIRSIVVATFVQSFLYRFNKSFNNLLDRYGIGIPGSGCQSSQFRFVPMYRALLDTVHIEVYQWYARCTNDMPKKKKKLPKIFVGSGSRIPRRANRYASVTIEI